MSPNLTNLWNGIKDTASGAYSAVKGWINGAADAFTPSPVAGDTAPSQKTTGGLGDSAPIPSGFKSLTQMGYGSNTGSPIIPTAPAEVTNPATNNVNALHSTLSSADTGPATFNVNTPDKIPSNYTNGSTSTGDVLNYRNSLQSDMTNGTNPSLYPTTGNSQVMNQNSAANYYTNTIPGAYNMTPEQIQTYNNYIAAQQRINTQKWQSAKQINDLYQSGSMTKDQADQAAQDIQRENDKQLADLTYAGQGAQLDYNTMQMVRQNAIAGVTAQAPYYAPTQISPGNSIVQAGTGQPLYDPYGMAGSANGNYNPPSSTGTSNSQPQLNGWAQQADGSYTDQLGYSISPVEAQKVATMPPQLQPYVKGSPLGVSYIDISQVPAPLQAIVQANAAKSGIKSLDAGGINALNAAQQILQIVDAAKALSIRNLASGTSGRITNTLAAWANNYLQNNPDLSNFAQLRDAAAKATTALAGGTGSGFRMNMGIIEAAVSNLPNATDNLETALTKADSLGAQIINGLKPAFPNVDVGNKYGNLLQSNYGGNSTPSKGNVIQTKVGAVDNSWFQ